MADKNGITPPYSSFPTFQKFIEKLKERGLPNRIDRSIWETNFSGSDGSHAVQAMKFLGLLTEDDVPTERLQRLVAADGGQYQSVLREALEDAYAPVLERVDLAKGTYKELQEAFSVGFASLSPSVQKKADLFFRKSTEHAGLLTSAYILKPPRRPVRRKKNVGSPPPSGSNGQDTPTAKQGGSGGGEVKPPPRDDSLSIFTLPLPGSGGVAEISLPKTATVAEWKIVSSYVTSYLDHAAGGGEGEPD